MTDLDTTTLAELAEINPAVDLRILSDESMVSFIPMSDVDESGRWVNRQERKLDHVRSGYTPFAEGDLLFAKITPCMENGKGAHAVDLTNGVGFGSTEFHVLRTRADNSPRFLFHWLQSPSTRTRAIAYMGGSAGQQRVQADFFTSYRVKAIDPREQTQIAGVLDKVDKAIANTEAVIAKLRQVRTGLLRDLLTCGLDENGELRDPIRHPEQFQDSLLGHIPKEWQVRTLESCVSSEITYGIVQAGPHVKGGVPYIRTGDMTGNRLVPDQMLRTSSEIAARFHRSRVQTGEIVCAIRATVGKVLLVPPALDGANLTQGTARIAPKQGVDAVYLLWTIRDDVTQRQIAREVKGTTFFEITLADLRKIKVRIPREPDEQRRITERIQALETSIANEVGCRVKLQNLKSGLMSDLLTGRVHVPESIGVGA